MIEYTITADSGVGKGRILQSDRDLAKARNFGCGTFNLCAASVLPISGTIAVADTSNNFASIFPGFCTNNSTGLRDRNL